MALLNFDGNVATYVKEFGDMIAFYVCASFMHVLGELTAFRIRGYPNFLAQTSKSALSATTSASPEIPVSNSVNVCPWFVRSLMAVSQHLL